MLMEEHTVGKLLLYVSYLYRQLRAQILAIDLYDTWVWVHVAPHFELIDQEMELSTSLEMQRLVLLDSFDR